MSVNLCGWCGAPLPVAAPRCPFCGAEPREGPARDVGPEPISFAQPLWLDGQEELASRLAPRAAGARPVVVMDAVDDELAKMSAWLVAETIWMTTDLPATAVAFHQRGVVTSPPSMDFEWFAPMIRKVGAPAAILWGRAPADGEWHLRVPTDGSERSFWGSLAECSEAIAAWLVERGLARRIERPAWWTPLPGPAPAERATAMWFLRQQILAREHLVKLDAASRSYFLDQTLSLAEKHPAEVHTLLARASLRCEEASGGVTADWKSRAARLRP